VSSHPLMVNSRRVVRAIVFASLLSVLFSASVSLAYGQFTLSVSQFTPATAVVPGGTATATIDLEASPGFSGLVSLTCSVTSGPATGLPPAPQCSISPQSQIPPADGPALNITTTGGTTNATPAGTYQITVTGTSPGATTQTVLLFLNVSDLTEDYTLSVLPTTALPSPIPAGSSATTTVTITPIGSYTGSVTLACLSITPVVTAAPYCTFAPPSVSVTSSSGATSTLTINTFGLAPSTSKLWNPSLFYAFWLAVPGLALVGAGTGGRHKRKLIGMLILVAVIGGLLLLPACNSGTIGRTARNGQVTPNNTYTFTLTATDANGAAPSNVTIGAATVTVQVITANTAH
jgi:trimeric autotransporter adhesin